MVSYYGAAVRAVRVTLCINPLILVCPMVFISLGRSDRLTRDSVYNLIHRRSGYTPIDLMFTVQHTHQKIQMNIGLPDGFYIIGPQ